MDLIDYENKAKELLDDTNVYSVIRNPTNRIQTMNNKIALSLFNGGYIDFQTKNKLVTYKAIPPKIYFLSKHHKSGLPTRPVTSYVGSALHGTSKYLAKILGKLKKGAHHVRNSFDFCEYINGTVIPNGYIMVSFDVKSLFTNIPMSTLKVILMSRWSEIEEHTTIPFKEFFEMVDLCTDNSYFVYKGLFYHQKSGAPMGGLP